jgi:ketosteroid isomerase-like protein
MDGRSYDNYQAYLHRFRDGKLLEGQTIPVDQCAFDAFLAD